MANISFELLQLGGGRLGLKLEQDNRLLGSREVELENFVDALRDERAMRQLLGPSDTWQKVIGGAGLQEVDVKLDRTLEAAITARMVGPLTAQGDLRSMLQRLIATQVAGLVGQARGSTDEGPSLAMDDASSDERGIDDRSGTVQEGASDE